MFRTHNSAYSPETLNTLTTSYRHGSIPEFDLHLLGNTIARSLARTRDTIQSLETLTQDPATLRGDSKPLRARHQRRGEYLTVEARNTETSVERDDHYTKMVDLFEDLDTHTNRLGEGIMLLATYIAHTFQGVEGEKVREFYPVSRYNSDKGNLEFGSQSEPSYFPLDRFQELELLREEIGYDNHVVQSLLELKLAAAALSATIDPQILRKIDRSRDYPDDIHSEVVDALQVVEANLGYLQSQNLGPDLKKLVDSSVPSKFTEWTQQYIDHQANPWFQRVAGGLGLVTGTASLVLGIPQLSYWVTEKFDLSYTPSLPIEMADTAALFLTSFGLSALIFGALTLGSDVGTRLARDFRNSSIHDVVEVG